MNNSRPFAISTQVAIGFVRIVTQPTMPGGPTPLVGALAFIDDVLTRANCRVIVPEVDHWRHTSRLCRETMAVGKLVADAQHAAIAIASGCTWVTRDKDFARFVPHGLDWQHLVLQAIDRTWRHRHGHSHSHSHVPMPNAIEAIAPPEIS